MLTRMATMKTKKLFTGILAFTLLLTGCKGKSAENSTDANTQAEIQNTKTVSLTTTLNLGEDNLVDYDSLQKFMTPDYTTETEDVKSEKEKKAKQSADSKDKSESVIPGLRKLSDYATKYSDKRTKTYATVEAPSVEEKDDPNVAFIINDWGPQGKIPSELTTPSFYVVFSQPVHALSALEEPSSESDILSIEPKLKGVFRWYGTKHLAFEAEEPADPSENYIIRVNPETKSLGGAKIKGQTSFRTKAEQLEINRIYGGYKGKGESDYGSITGALPPYENTFFIRLNYKTTEQHLKENLVVKVGTKKVNFDTRILLAPESDSVWGFTKSSIFYDVDAKKSNSFVITITDEVPHNASVSAGITGTRKDSVYQTLKPFKLSNVSDFTEYSYGTRVHPLTVTFTQAIDKATVKDNISFDFEFELSDENFEVKGRTLTLFNLPIDFAEVHSISFGEGLKDIYGQEIELTGRSTYNFTVRNAESYVKFLDYGANMLEAQFPHKMIFEYQNLEPGSYYKVSATDSPFDFTSEFGQEGKLPDGLIPVDVSTRNVRQFQEVEFDPYLKNGFGFVKFDSLIRRTYWNYWDDCWDKDSLSQTMTIQVTDLGITSRVGINKAVVMVRSLSTGKPVADADVKIIYYVSGYNYKLEDNVFATGKTDANGLCVINFTEDQIMAFENNARANYSDNVRVMVVNGDDKAVYTPDSHNIWSFGNVNSSYTREVRKPKQRTFMFVDRGLYKPGETVTFRGIDMDQLLGTLKAHEGDYSYTVEGNWWDAPVIIQTVSGTLSESGGFYGSFQIPDDVEPGNYGIYYRRAESQDKYDYQICSFTIAEFERLKIAAEIEVPEITYFGGDKISADVSAEYLAGGVLNGADYKANWYKQGSRFESEVPETKEYSFGPYDKYSWRTYYSDESGKLANNGSAQLKCNSEKIDDGLTYSYRVEANVTDISNQRVMAASSITVHPALFYAGLKMAMTSGFPKKNQKLEFPYVLTDVKGNKLTAEEIKAKVENLTYTLKRDEWTMVHEQSINDSVYSRYEKTVVDEATGNVSLNADGNLEITPEKAGWYTLELTGKDKKGNAVITSMGFYVTGSGMGWYGNGNSADLNMTPNQNLYNPGDTAQILLQSPLQKGDYLITVEREGIFTEEIRHFDEPANVIEIPIASNYVPCVYVAVSSYSERNGPPTHEYGETDLDKPKGYFGVARLDVNPNVRAFSVEIECDKKVYQPGEEATITLTATKGGKPVSGAELTLMAVDRGVLDLINYHVPNPIEFFYAPYNFPLCVKGGDSRSLLMDPVTYSVKNLAGGDADAASDEEKDEDERRDYRPTAVFEPALITDANGKVTVTFKLPDSLTTYRITAFGIKDSLFALQEEETKVQNPINVQAVQPRKLRERDTAECGVLITNLNNEGQKVKVNLEVRIPTRDTAEDAAAGRKTIPGKASIDGSSSHEIYIASGDSSVVYFDVAAEQSGTVELVYTVESADGKKDKMSSPIKIEKTYVYETVTMVGDTGTDVPSEATENFIIPGFAKNGHGELSVTLDATRLGLLGTSVNYLFAYPYGCLEQQSSRILPLVIFDEYIDVFGLDSNISDTKTVVLNSFKDWSKSQLNNGGFPYWPGSYSDSLYVSIKIAHICGAAIQRGYKEEDLSIDIDALISYIGANASKSKNDYLSAYACYVTKLLDRHNMDSVLSNLYNRREELPLTVQALAALAFCEDNGINSLTKADSINKNIRTYLQPVERSVTIRDSNRKDDFWWWYESPVEQMALILQAFVKVNPEDQMVDRLLYTLMQNQKGGYWTNTIATSRVLDAIYTLIKMRNLDQTEFTGTASIANKKIMSEQFSGAGAKPKTLKLPFEGEIISALAKDEATPITFEKDGNGNLYYTVEMKYALPDEMHFARDEGLKIKYEISDYETGELLNKQNDESSLLTLESGKLYKASIRLESTRDRTYLAMRAPIPSGAEILDSTFVTVGAEAEITNSSESWGHWLSNKTIYDNEIQFFWDNFRTGSTTVTFTFRAARRGVYPTPPVQAEAMYEPEIFGRSDGYLVVIK